MSTYREIHGRAVRSVSTDPTAEVTEGEIWYNTSSDTFKSVVNLQAWVSSAPLLQDYRQGGYAGDTQSSYMIFGGYPIPTNNNKTFEYNGSGWAAGGNLGTGKYLNGGAGTQTAGLDYGGYNGSAPITIPGGNVTQEYNGTAWSDASATMGTARYNCLGSGTQTAALSAAGINAPPGNASTANNNFSEEYNGSSWSEGNNLNTPRSLSGSQSGTQTAAIMFGGFAYPSSFKSDVENYDGTSWTSGTSLPAGRSRAGTSGTQTDALVYGGALPSVTDTCLSWDGTTFSSVPSLATARQGGGNSQNAPSTGAVLAGGSPSPKTMTEEFTSSANVITAGAWGTGGAMNTARSLMGSFGTRTAAVAVAGLKNPYATYSNDTEKYDGTSWTASGNYPQSIYSVGSAGTSTAGLAFGGILPGSSSNTTCEFDGSTWTAQGSPGNVPVSGGYSNGFGTQTAAIANLPGASTTIAYDGSSWTAFGSPGNMNTGRLDGYGQNGTSTAGLVVAGRTAPGPTNTTNTEEWDGSTWTAAGAYPVAMVFVQSNGTQTAAAGAGGDKMPGETSQTTTCTYDGSTWATAPNLGTAVSRHGGANVAPSTQGTIYSGNVPAITTTQEFTGETTALNVKTLTQS